MNLDWYDRQKQLNHTKVYTAEEIRKMNRNFYLGACFCLGLVICFVVWKMKN